MVDNEEDSGLDTNVTLQPDDPDGSSQSSGSSHEDRGACVEFLEGCGCYNLVLVFCCFMCYCIFCGIAYTSGIYFVFFKEEFGTGSGVTSWVGSIHFGMILFNAPLAGFLTDRFGFRPVVMLGGLIATIGLIATAFVNSIYEVVLTFSIITGFGIGLVYVPGLTIVSYLEKGRVLANGFSASGCGFGQFVMPYVIHSAIEAYNWRGSMLICAGITLQLLVLGALMRPPKVWQNLIQMKKQNPKVAEKRVDFGLRFFKDPDVVLCYVHYILFSGSYGLIFVHITAMTEDLTGVTRKRAVFVVSILGLSTIFGRIASGFIGQHPRVDTFLFHILCTLIAGLSAIFVPLLSIYPCIVTWAAIFGLFTSPSNCLYQILLLNFVDISDLNTTVPHLTVAMAIGMLLAAPVAGWIYDGTKFYGSSFYLGGAMVTASSLLLLWPYVKYRSRHRAPISVDIKQQVKAYSFGSMLGSQYFEVSMALAKEPNRETTEDTKVAISGETIT